MSCSYDIYYGKKRPHGFLKFASAAALTGAAAFLLTRLLARRPDPISDEVIEGDDVIGETGEETTFSIVGLPGKRYAITVYNPSSQESGSKGLEAQTADDEGRCSWSWMVGTNTGLGEGRIVVSDGEGRAWDFKYEVRDER